VEDDMMKFVVDRPDVLVVADRVQDAARELRVIDPFPPAGGERAAPGEKGLVRDADAHRRERRVLVTLEGCNLDFDRVEAAVADHGVDERYALVVVLHDRNGERDRVWPAVIVGARGPVIELVMACLRTAADQEESERGEEEEREKGVKKERSEGDTDTTHSRIPRWDFLAHARIRSMSAEL